ncbi:MAG TPA: radical SAM protein [Geobacteraceae bacterium]|nr:radical SAM protein [Geobacteraceae bacterium]
MKAPIVPFFISHRGCPHQCIFCDQQKIAGAVGDLPSAGEILDRVAAYRLTSGFRPVEVAFYGGSFTGLARNDQQRLLVPLRDLLAIGEVSSVRVSTRPDAIDEDTASFLRESGVRTVELGVQSMDDAVLERANRGHSAADVVQAVSVLRTEGLLVGLQLMPGLPGDTHEISLWSLSRALDLGPDFLRIYPTVVVAGTALARQYAEGRYHPLSLGEAVALCKQMLLRALLGNVPVIRLGLQPTADLSRKGVVLAGPYHPAFRQMVEAELCFDLLKQLIPPGPNPVTVSCFPSKIADVAGQRRSNIRRLQQDCGVRVEKISGDALLSPFDLVAEGTFGILQGNILRDLSYTKKENPYV